MASMRPTLLLCYLVGFAAAEKPAVDVYGNPCLPGGTLPPNGLPVGAQVGIGIGVATAAAIAGTVAGIETNQAMKADANNGVQYAKEALDIDHAKGSFQFDIDLPAVVNLSPTEFMDKSQVKAATKQRIANELSVPEFWVSAKPTVTQNALDPHKANIRMDVDVGIPPTGDGDTSAKELSAKIDGLGPKFKSAVEDGAEDWVIKAFNPMAALKRGAAKLRDAVAPAFGSDPKHATCTVDFHIVLPASILSPSQFVSGPEATGAVTKTIAQGLEVAVDWISVTPTVLQSVLDRTKSNVQMQVGIAIPSKATSPRAAADLCTEAEALSPKLRRAIEAQASRKAPSMRGAAAGAIAATVTSSTMLEGTAAGATVMEVADTTPFPAGTEVCIGSGLTMECDTVLSVAVDAAVTGRRLGVPKPGKLTFATPLKNPHGAGAVLAAIPVSTTSSTMLKGTAAGATVVEVADTTPFLAGTSISIGSELLTKEYNTVLSVAVDAAVTGRRLDVTKPGKLTLATPMKNPHAVGSVLTAIPVSTTTTMTPWDSSSGSSGGSVDSSNSLPQNGDSSSSGASSGSAASGSSGFYMKLWIWFLLIGLLCLCLAAAAGLAVMSSHKKKPLQKRTVSRTRGIEAPAPEPVADTPFAFEALPLMAPQLMFAPQAYAPLAYNAPATASYASIPAPATTSYASSNAPATTSYASSPAATSYASSYAPVSSYTPSYTSSAAPVSSYTPSYAASVPAPTAPTYAASVPAPTAPTYAASVPAPTAPTYAAYSVPIPQAAPTYAAYQVPVVAETGYMAPAAATVYSGPPNQQATPIMMESVAAAYPQAGPARNTPGMFGTVTDSLFGAIDINHDGVITRDEFRQALHSNIVSPG